MLPGLLNRVCVLLLIVLIFSCDGVSAERSQRRRAKKEGEEQSQSQAKQAKADRFECPVFSRDADEILEKAQQLLENNEVQVALSCVEDALIIDDNSAEAHGLHGELLMHSGNAYDAIKSCRRAVDINSAIHGNHLRLAAAYRVSKLYEEAQDSVDVARLLAPEEVEIEVFQVKLAMEVGDLEGAIVAARRVRDLKKEEFFAHFSLAKLLQKSPHHMVESLYTYKAAFHLMSPDASPSERASVFFATFYSEQYLCEWSEYYEHLVVLPEILEAELEASRGREPPNIRPVQMLLHVGKDQIKEAGEGFSFMDLRAARQYANYAAKNNNTYTEPLQTPSEGDGRLRVGFVSADMGNHPVGTQFQSIFGMMDKSEFVSVAYALRESDGSKERQKMEAESDKLLTVASKRIDDIRKQIKRDNIHVLLDMNGLTSGSKQPVFGMRQDDEVPLQAGLIGWPGSMHTSALDTTFVDRVVVPPDQGEVYFSESPMYMPDTYQVNDYKQSGHFDLPSEQELAAIREEEGIPQDAFVFADFNGHFKLEPMIFATWMNILQRVPNSVLWLMAHEGLSMDNLAKEVLAAGVAPERVIFAPYKPNEEHVKRSTIVDLALDTSIYGGHTTTSHLLWAGVPVLTLPAEKMVTRVSTAMVDSVGLSELVVKTFREYEDRAVALATSA